MSFLQLERSGQNKIVILYCNKVEPPLTHISADDMEFGLVARTGTWNINILTQAPKSLDTNVCDLSFFRALLQSEQWQSDVDNIDGLIAQVLRAFERFDERKNDFGFLTLQCCLDDILKRNGGNTYSI